MIPNVSRGGNIVGLVSYLAGPGRANEHVEPHLVAGSSRIMAWYSTEELSHQDALDIGKELAQTQRVTGVEVNGGHVWHCSLSLHKQDGVRSDQDWEQIATDFMQRMGFIGVEGKADTPWVAIHHGGSGTNQNDHIHLAVQLVREDGTKADVWRDRPKSQSVARELEQKYGLMQVKPGHGAPGVTAAELNAAKARGRTEAERVTIGRLVRGMVTQASTEDELVRRMRQGGLLVSPRFKSGDMSHVTGYSVALKPPPGHQPVYYAGSKVARDLGLRVLREQKGWPTSETPEPAVAEWQAAKFGRRVVNTAGPESREVTGEALEAATEQLAHLRSMLRDVPFSDSEQWRKAASFVSGAYAAMSNEVEPVPGDLARVSDELAKSAQVSRSSYKPSGRPLMGMASATALSFAAHNNSAAGQLAFFVQMSKLARSIHEYNKARNDMVRESSMRDVAGAELARVSDSFHAAAGVVPSGTKRGVSAGRKGRSVVEPGPVVAPDLTQSKNASGLRR